MPEITTKDIKKDIYLMLHKSQEMLELTADAFNKNRTPKLEEAMEIAGEIHAKEDALTAALAKIASSNNEARTIVSVPAHLEKIATSIKRMIDNTQTRIKEGQLFSDRAIHEAGTLFNTTKEILKKAGDTIVTGNKAASETVMKESDKLVRMANDFAAAHEQRLVSGEASPKSSTTYLCILYAFEDLAWHLKETVRKLTT